MAASCPYCQHRISVADPKPGRFRAKCPRCAKPVALVIPADPATPWEIRALLADTEVNDGLPEGQVRSAGASGVVAPPASRSGKVARPDERKHLFDTPTPAPGPGMGSGTGHSTQLSGGMAQPPKSGVVSGSGRVPRPVNPDDTSASARMQRPPGADGSGRNPRPLADTSASGRMNQPSGRMPQPSGAVRQPSDRMPKPPDAGPPQPRKPPAGSLPGAVADDDMPARKPIASLPGYRIEKALGHGGMGTVFLARQLSLDRPVALKVMSKRWSNDAVFVARFTREAYAAALLNHPNVVQIFDIGESDGTRFFSMEFVPGRSLAELVKTDGKVDPETAVGYILQAARGLKHAHDRGMIHRDVKPDNLMLSDQGIVKVADLGLVKTPGTQHLDQPSAGSDSGHSTRPNSRQAGESERGVGLNSFQPNMTGARMALGTPAYMAPEQCRDAAAVDHRADIYSLGCTLYVLVTGKPPFEGHTAVELMTKHAYEPLTPPERVVSRVPKELSAVIQRMMAKNAGDRFPNMGEVVRTLEQWLGVHHTGTFSPRDDQIDKVEEFARAFNTTPVAVLRSRLVTGLVSGAALFAVLLAFFGRLDWAFGLAGMLLQGTGVYFVLNGLGRKTYLFQRVRQFVFGLTVGDWMVTVAGLGLFALLLWMLGLFWMWLGFGIVGGGLAFALHYGLDKSIDDARRETIEKTERLLRRMRLNGVGEEDLRQFVAKYAGRHWEEYFEALFGYEAKLAARGVLLRGGSAGQREKFAAWREPLIGLIDRIEEARTRSRERALLAEVEAARLMAAGVDGAQAKEQAAVAADALVKQADRFRDADHRQAAAGKSSPGVPNLQDMLDGTAAGPDPVEKRGAFAVFVGLFVGPHVRMPLAAFLLACCALWFAQNGFVADIAASDKATLAKRASQSKPLSFDGVPAKFTDWCDTANAGWAGVLLLVSLFYRGNLMSLMVLLGAAVIVLGHRFGIQTVEPIRNYHVSLMLGSVFCLIGYRVGRRNT